jgi:protein ImuA
VAAPSPFSVTLSPSPPTAIDGVWRGSELATATFDTKATGFSALDVELPGAGWPKGALTEVLQVQPGLHEWRLLLPALRGATAKEPVVLIGCPHLPNLPAISCHGVSTDAVLVVDAQRPADRLWAAEQALRCGQVGAVLTWLPKAQPEQLRRLQMASNLGGKALVFAFRPAACERESSPAPLRLRVEGLSRLGLEIHVVKRRGPSLDHPVRIPAPFPVVASLRKRLRMQPALHAVDCSISPPSIIQPVSA